MASKSSVAALPPKAKLLCYPPTGPESIVFDPLTFLLVFEIAGASEDNKENLRADIKRAITSYFGDLYAERFHSSRLKLLSNLSKASKHARALAKLLDWPPLRSSARRLEIQTALTTTQDPLFLSAEDAAFTVRVLAELADSTSRPRFGGEADLRIDSHIASLAELAQLLQKIESASELLDAQERPKAQNAQKTSLFQLAQTIVKMWIETLGNKKASLAQGSRFLRFANAIFALVGQSTNSHSTLRDRFQKVEAYSMAVQRGWEIAHGNTD